MVVEVKSILLQRPICGNGHEELTHESSVIDLLTKMSKGTSSGVKLGSMSSFTGLMLVATSEDCILDSCPNSTPNGLH